MNSTELNATKKKDSEGERKKDKRFIPKRGKYQTTDFSFGQTIVLEKRGCFKRKKQPQVTDFSFGQTFFFD